MRANRFNRTFAVMLAASIGILPITGLADSPDNLNIIWARTTGKTGTTADTAPIYSRKSTKSKVISRYPHSRVILIAGVEPDQNGQDWYEVVYPFKGWLEPSKTWIVDRVGGYYPEKIPLPERLYLRIAIDVGTYPESSMKIFGKPRDANYAVEFGNKVVQTLFWKGMTVEYSNFNRRADQAEISRITLYKGAKTGFGPIHVGDPVEKLAILGIEKPQDANGEVTTGTEEYRFRFTYHDGKITTMSYCYRDRGFMDAP